MRQTRVPIGSFEGPCQRIVWPEQRPNSPESFLLIFHRERWFAFQNFCPHWRIPLADKGHEAFDGDSSYLICRSHAAVFRLRDGLCVSGPCIDESLVDLDVRVEGNELLIQEGRALKYAPAIALSEFEE